LLYSREHFRKQGNHGYLQHLAVLRIPVNGDPSAR